MKLFYQRKIGVRMGLGFATIVLLTTLLGITALVGMNNLTKTTEDLYKHPLAVSSAVRDIQTAIVSMHRSMKDVVLAKTDGQLKTAINQVDEYEKEVFSLFDILFDRFLGDQSTVEAAYDAFANWKAIRQEVIELVDSEEIDRAAEITKGKGADHVDFMNEQIQKMGDFATRKAETFFNNAQASRQLHLWTMSGLILVIAGLCVFSGIIITRSITGPVTYIIGQMSRISDGDLDHKIEIKNNDEIGQLAHAFNEMTSSLKKTTTSRNELNAANQQLQAGEQQLRATNQQLQAGEQQIKATNQQLKASTKQAEFANKAKSQFLANMSHEIRTPINVIMGFTDLLDNDGLDEKQGESITYIRQSTQSLLRLIEDILDISKIEAGKLDVVLKECSLDQLLTSIKTTMQIATKGKDLKFDIIRADQLPATMLIDYGRVHQCLVNLIGNAIKFTEKGYVHLKVTVKDISGKLFLCFDVEDTGIGIPADRQDAIFEMFTQADNSHTRKYGGTGLGLSITKRLIELLEGTFSFTSEEGKGSVFSMMIPAGIDMDSAILLDSDQSIESVLQNQTDKAGFLSGSVLLAEDNEGCQVLAKKHLESFGVEVTIVGNGNEAVEAVGRQSFDLILMDMQMPYLNGYQTAKKLKEDGVLIPIVAMTAYAMAGDREKCIEAGCIDYISKPFTKDVLSTILKEYLAPTSDLT